MNNYSYPPNNIFGNNPYLNQGYQNFNTMGYQQQFNNSQPQQENTFLSGQMVDSIDVVKAKNVDLTGNPTWYPKTDKSEVYCKQLNQQGNSVIYTYKLVDNDNVCNENDFEKVMYEFKNDIFIEINKLKRLITNEKIKNITDSEMNGGDE